MNTIPKTCETCLHWQRLASRAVGVCREDEEEAPLAHRSYSCHKWRDADATYCANRTRP